MGTIQRVFSAAALAVLCGGCSSGAWRGEQTGEAAGPATTPNGVNFNGVNFNGVNFNGINFNGVDLDAVRLDPLLLGGLSLGGQALAGVALDGAALTGSLGGSPLRGSDLVGAQLAGSLSNGAAVTLRIDGVAADGEADVQQYTVSASVAGGAFNPLCGTGSDGTPVPAIPLAGTWDESEGTATGGAHVGDPGTFTFACEGYALAKCVNFGYAPWRSVNECRTPGDCATRSLAPFHQACTRLLRADYCGDGTPTTRDGTQVDVWDLYGIQADDQPTWGLEAEWSPDGAVCVDQTRWATLPAGGDVQAYIAAHCPGRWQTPGCGGAGSTFFSVNGFDVPLDSRALLRSRVEETQP